jgi:hypothetical protein
VPETSSAVAITLSVPAPRRAQWITVNGSGFDPRQQYLVRVVQGDQGWVVQVPTSPRGDGSFAVPVRVPPDATPGTATVVACVVTVNRGPTADCGRTALVIEP